VTPQNRQQNARDELQRSEEALRAADELLRLGLHNDSVSRAYYAAYHCARAVLFTRELESKTHRGVNQLLGLHWVRPGALPMEATALLARLEDRRECSDYAAGLRFGADEAAESAQQARAFIAFCRPALDKAGVLLP
jgi:uncharacterized protein (UPF0332 family)